MCSKKPNRLNCWEFKQCERQPGGKKIKEHGICPASTDVATNNINKGINAGRLCWQIAGTLCTNKVQGSYAKKLKDCLKCEFMRLVQKEECREFVISNINK